MAIAAMIVMASSGRASAMLIEGGCRGLETRVVNALVVEVLVSMKYGDGGGDLGEEDFGNGDEAVGRRPVWPQVMQIGQGSAQSKCG
jgi:hypothetical protein